MRQTWGRAGACSRRLIIAIPCYAAKLSGHHRDDLPFNAAMPCLPSHRVYRRIIGDFREVSPFYRGCVRVERRGQAPALQKNRAGNSLRKERTHFPRTPLPVCGRELPASSSATALLALNSEAFSAGVAQSPAIECQYSRHNNTRAGGRGTPP